MRSKSTFRNGIFILFYFVSYFILFYFTLSNNSYAKKHLAKIIDRISTIVGSFQKKKFLHRKKILVRCSIPLVSVSNSRESEGKTYVSFMKSSGQLLAANGRLLLLIVFSDISQSYMQGYARGVITEYLLTRMLGFKFSMWKWVILIIIKSLTQY